jgi:hypothetical protein
VSNNVIRNVIGSGVRYGIFVHSDQLGTVRGLQVSDNVFGGMDFGVYFGGGGSYGNYATDVSITGNLAVDAPTGGLVVGNGSCCVAGKKILGDNNPDDAPP